MQAALFRNGILWRLPLSRLDAWRESPSSVSPATTTTTDSLTYATPKPPPSPSPPPTTYRSI